MSGVTDPLEGRSFSHIENVIYLPSTPSTNDVAKTIVEKMLAESEDIRPTIIVAGEQTAGHGRMGRSWTSLPGALAVSVIVPWPEGPERVRLPVRAGIALARGLSRAFALDVRLKWPNDLLVNRRKLGGILVEARANDEGEGWAVVGVGLNVRGTRKDLDARGLRDATSLEDAGVAAARLAGVAPLSALLDILDVPLGEAGKDPLAGGVRGRLGACAGRRDERDGRGPLRVRRVSRRERRRRAAPFDRARRGDDRFGRRRPLLEAVSPVSETPEAGHAPSPADPGLDEAGYATRIEDAFIAERGTPFLVSAKDWSLIRGWREAGVPADTVVRAVREAFERRRARGQAGKISSLAYCADAVAERWEMERRGLVGKEDASRPRPRTRPRSAKSSRRSPQRFARREKREERDLLRKEKERDPSATSGGEAPGLDLEVLRRGLNRAAAQIEEISPDLPFEEIEHKLSSIEASLVRAGLKAMNSSFQALVEERVASALGDVSGLSPHVVERMRKALTRREVRALAGFPPLTLLHG